MENAALIYDAIRTPRGKGKATGALHEVKPINLVGQLLDALETRAPGCKIQAEDLTLGCVTPVGEQGYNVAKAALLAAGWPQRIPGMQLNRYCASGLEAVNLSAIRIMSGQASALIAGGVESMSRVPMGQDGGVLLEDDAVIEAIPHIPQGVAADLIATLHGISRRELDQCALRSHLLAASATTEGWLEKSLIPVKGESGEVLLSADETIRPDTSLDRLAELRPAFLHVGKKRFDALALRKYPQAAPLQHLHTAGNASGIVDGASLVFLGNEAIGKELGWQPRARIKAMLTTAAEPTIMLTGPVPACRQVLKQAGMRVQDIDLWEINEAFAVVPLFVQRQLGIDPDLINVNGGAIAMGHPLGATGAMLLGTLVDELERRDLSTGMVTLCAGGGIGIATVVERV